MKNIKSIGQSLYLLIHNTKVRSNCRYKLREICAGKHLPEVSKAVISEYNDLWETVDRKPDPIFLRCMIAVSGVQSPLFIPEDTYYTKIEPTLNNRVYAIAYNDKNFFERYLHEHRKLFPITYLRRISGVFYDRNFDSVSKAEVKSILKDLAQDEEYILKPATETGAGDGVCVIRFDNDMALIDGKPLNLDKFLNDLCARKYYDFVLQERIKQCDWFSHFCPNATNIIRVFSYRSVITNEIHILHSYYRYGFYEDSFKMYLKNGGLRQGINLDGLLDDYAIGYNGDIDKELAVINSESIRVVPMYKEIIETVQCIGPKFYHHRLLGFDFIIDQQEKVRLLEVNLRNIGMIHHQLINGPLFGKYTNEIVDYCKTNQKSASVHFYY